MFQLRANVKTLSLRRWLACLVTLAVIGGAALSFVAGTVLQALQTPFRELWLLTSLQIAVAASFNSTMLVWMHRWAIIPTWVVFILLGNTSSGGAVSASLLPQPFAFLNHALPSGRPSRRSTRRPTSRKPAAAAVHRPGPVAGGMPDGVDRLLTQTRSLAGGVTP